MSVVRFSRSLVVGSWLSVVVVLALASGARADFSRPMLLSGTAEFQFGEASSPALSEDGHYAVFRGSLGEVPGIYRRNLDSGQIELVAGGDASAPSISAEGRFIAFTTTAVLTAAAKSGAGCPQVFVRDMDREPQPGAELEEPSGSAGEEPWPADAAYVLASALDGQRTGLSYSSCSTGSQTTAGVALSADGQRVVFTVSASDLTPGVEGAQVAVRDLQTAATTLVSVTPEGAATPGGGAALGGFTATISANGSTVAWYGTNVPAQVPGSFAEIEEGMRLYGGSGREAEPLWRRLALGSSTRRLLAGAGLEFYARTYQGNEGIPYKINGGALGGAIPVSPVVLSANGDTAVTLADAPTPENLPTYGRLVNGSPTPPTDAYAVRVSDDLSVPPQVTPLTATPNFLLPRVFTESSVEDVAISPDGSRVAFNAIRPSFTLPSPALVSPPAPAGDYTYEVNLPLDTLQRVTSTYDGLAPAGGEGQISFSEDGLSLAFESTATNFFYGDALLGADEVYLVHESPNASRPAEQAIEPALASLPPSPRWMLSATATPQPDGGVLVDAAVPGAGQLAVGAAAQLPAVAERSIQRLAQPHGSHAKKAVTRIATARGRRPSRRTGKGVARVPFRTIGRAEARADGTSDIQLRLKLSSHYRSLLDRRGGLYCLLHVAFRASGHATLVREIPVTLRIVLRPARHKAAR